MTRTSGGGVGCRDFRRATCWNRREVLRLGSLGALGLLLPDAPAEVRGPFPPVAPSVAGVQFSELLPRSARLMHRLALLRSLNHRHPDHVQSSLPALTGHHHPDSEDLKDDPPPSPADVPPFRAVL